MLRKFLRFGLKHNIHKVLTPAKNTTPKPTIEWLWEVGFLILLKTTKFSIISTYY